MDNDPTDAAHARGHPRHRRGACRRSSKPHRDAGQGRASRLPLLTESESTMLRSMKDMLDYSILATDGEIGQVSDILLGDSDLKGRYLVIDTGGWLPGRKVLLSTSWLSCAAPSRKAPVFKPEKKRIQESPPYDPDVAVPRDVEPRLYDHYGFPYYWQ